MWLRYVLNKAGVDTQQFGAHRTRVASTSAANTFGVPVDVLLRAARWSSESTGYPALQGVPATSMGQALLDSYIHKQ